MKAGEKRARNRAEHADLRERSLDVADHELTLDDVHRPIGIPLVEKIERERQVIVAREDPFMQQRSVVARRPLERLWPRGLSKDEAAIDLWPKEIGPSTGLRKWYGHDPDQWEEFRKRYWAELDRKGDRLDDLKQKFQPGPVTFVDAARDQEHNSAVVLKECLERGPRP